MAEQMNQETLEALKGSIEKWEGIYAGTGVDEGTDNCDLCLMFREVDENYYGIICPQCPVREETSEHGCKKTPHQVFVDYVQKREDFDLDSGCKVFDEKSKQLALDELNFLKSLLPDGHDDR